MIRFDKVQATEGWFQESGSDYDVVVASRVRVSRNLTGHPFPHLLQNTEETQVSEEISAACAAVGLECASIGQLEKLERRMLLERNYISREFALQGQKVLALSPDRSVSGMINEVDHLRLAVIHGGRTLDLCWELADDVDTRLEELLDYAVTLEWGYLNAEVTNSGTGLRCSSMLHLPALAETGLLEKAFKAVVQVGMTVKGFFDDEESSRGQMYQISNQLTFGLGEQDLIEKLDAITLQLVHYERKAREELLDHARTDLEDRVLRALGILRYCRKLPAREAVEHLSSLRLGASLGMIKAPMERITALLFLSQKAHIEHMVDGLESGADKKDVDAVRADLVREALIQEDVNWEDLHV